MSFQTLVLIPEQDMEHGTFSRGGLSSGRNSTVVGVLCAVVYRGPKQKTLYHGDKDPETGLLGPLSLQSIYELGNLLRRRHSDGIHTVTWHGLVEIFEPLSKIAPDERVRKMWEDIALSHIDMAFDLFCAKGFTTNLSGILKGMSIPDKVQALDAFSASMNWSQSFDVQKAIFKIAYDRAATIHTLYRQVAKSQKMRWISSTGNAAYWNPDIVIEKSGEGRLLTVAEALQMPEPDVSWMDKKFHRTRMDYCAWMPGFTQPNLDDDTDYSISFSEEPPADLELDMPGRPQEEPTDAEPEEVKDPQSDVVDEVLEEGSDDDTVVLHMSDAFTRAFLRFYAEAVKLVQPQADWLAKELIRRLDKYEAQ